FERSRGLVEVEPHLELLAVWLELAEPLAGQVHDRRLERRSHAGRREVLHHHRGHGRRWPVARRFERVLHDLDLWFAPYPAVRARHTGREPRKHPERQEYPRRMPAHTRLRYPALVELRLLRLVQQ